MKELRLELDTDQTLRLKALRAKLEEAQSGEVVLSPVAHYGCDAVCMPGCTGGCATDCWGTCSGDCAGSCQPDCINTCKYTCIGEIFSTR